MRKKKNWEKEERKERRKERGRTSSSGEENQGGDFSGHSRRVQTTYVLSDFLRECSIQRGEASYSVRFHF